MKALPFAAALLLLLAFVSRADAKPNLIYILADDMGYADAGFNGGKEIKTPHLDKLAKGGTVLTSFYVQPVCSPTRAALMTGRYPNNTGIYSVIKPRTPWGLKLEERTVAEALRDAGYQTAISGKWHLGEFEKAYRPTHRGFESQYGHWFGQIDYFTHRRDGMLDWHRNDVTCEDEGYSTHLIASEACRIIREKDPIKPLFLYIPFNAVHGPHQVPDSYCEPYTDLKGVRRTYAGMLSAMDEAVGQVVAALEEKGIRDNTLILFSSDNGGAAPGRVTDNGPLRAGKGTIYEGGVRVCAFANWPGHIPAGKTVDEPLHAVDWYPTLTKLAGSTAEPKLPLDGHDIMPVLTEGAKSPHEALILNGTKRGQAAIRKGDWKLLVGVGNGDQLYNLAQDIGEKTDLANENPDQLKELRALYDAMMEKAVPHGEPGAGASKKAARQE